MMRTLLLTHFRLIFQFYYTSWKHQKIKGFLVFSGGIKWELVKRAKKFNQVSVTGYLSQICAKFTTTYLGRYFKPSQKLLQISTSSDNVINKECLCEKSKSLPYCTYSYEVVNWWFSCKFCTAVQSARIWKWNQNIWRKVTFS